MSGWLREAIASGMVSGEAVVVNGSVDGLAKRMKLAEALELYGGGPGSGPHAGIPKGEDVDVLSKTGWLKGDKFFPNENGRPHIHTMRQHNLAKTASDALEDGYIRVTVEGHPPVFGLHAWTKNDIRDAVYKIPSEAQAVYVEFEKGKSPDMRLSPREAIEMYGAAKE